MTTPGQSGPVPPPENAAPLRLLLVEDDDGDALLVEEMLYDTGLTYDLRRSKTLAEALDDLGTGGPLARDRGPDCVLLDLHLPDASGVDAVRSLRQASPGTAVIVLTGLAESDAGAEAVAAGAQDYLVKGKVEAELLRRALRYAIHRKQAERANAELRENRILAAENARLEHSLLPTPLLEAPSVGVLSRYVPGRERALLSGDFLDVVQTGDGLIHAVIGDVSGHGPDQAALGVCLRITWRALTLAGHGGIGLLDLLERMLVAERTGGDLFATCTLLTVDPAARRATLHLAGHHEPLLLTGAGPTEAIREVSGQHGLALGIVPGLRRWYPTTFELPDEGTLLLYTDGLIEGHRDAGGDRLGTDGLIELIHATGTGDPDARLDALLTTVRRMDAGRHTDDIAILQLSWPHGAPQAMTPTGVIGSQRVVGPGSR
ncbi:PP2C family protein-serine/threonine phosphatase [Streptomyces avicenniae]|uniref:PP2C family protein-serine/threonine phosphatase n=1 Tax=Streptomyces avicenniae TaxID=500153 RepID=UPI00069C65C6|nr:SpoIIE family protein phosphatase [Streptomyces avicenniae]